MFETTGTASAFEQGEALVLDTLAEMNLNALELSGLDEKSYTMIQIAGLVAMDALPVSYAMTLEAATDLLEVADLQAVLVALAPVVGSAQLAAAASNVFDSFLDTASDTVAEDAGAADDTVAEVADAAEDERADAEMDGQASELVITAVADDEPTDEASTDEERELEAV
jgi:4-carboxymuconolactone decarboxylase